jgi:hypothetical protein
MKTSTLTATRTFPFVKGFKDYNEIPAYAASLKKLFGDVVRGKELSFSEGNYWGVFYVDGGMPTPDEIENECSWES